MNIDTSKTTQAKAVIGNDGWLFLSNDSNRTWDQFEGRLLLSEEDAQSWQQELSRRTAFMRSNNIHYRFMVAPNKESIVPEYVPVAYQKASARLVHQIEAAAEQAGVHSMFLERFIMRHSERAGFYDKGDTHWNAFGAWHVTNHVFKGLEIRRPIAPITSDEVTFQPSDSFIGDLSNKFDPPISQGGGVHPIIHKDTARYSFSNQITNHGHVSIWEGGDPEGPTILLFGDSFAGALTRYFALRSRRLVRVHTTSIDRELVFRERPEVVLSVVVERFLRTPPKGIAEFSYKTDLREKLAALDASERQRLVEMMKQVSDPANRPYAADLLSSLPLE